MVQVTEDIFANSTVDPFTKKSEAIRRFTIANGEQMSVQVITLGATITSVKVPDANFQVDDVVLGFDDLAGYQGTNNPYFGATVGRVCNRVANGRFQLDGKQIEVTKNWNNKHQLHGGRIGFDKANWKVLEVRDDGVTMSHTNPDGHEGYPGEVTSTVHFTLTEDNCLHVRMEAVTTAPTAINLTNHSYFNLAGHGAGPDAIYSHTIEINAYGITETDGDSIPTGVIKSLDGTAFDLRTECNLGERLKQLLPAKGFDDNYCIEWRPPQAITKIAKATHPSSGRWLEIASNQPGVQFYTSNFLPNPAAGEQPTIGKSGAKYIKHGAFCLETQKFPDAVNHSNFPSTILRPGENYNHEVIYKFGVYRNH